MTAKPPFNHLHFADARVSVEQRANGEKILRSPQRLQAYPHQLGVYLRRWAKEKPRALLLAERASDGSWRRVHYAEMLAAVEALGQALIDRGMSAEQPLMLLSENSIDLAKMTLAGLYVGVPVVPVSPAYSLMSRDFGKLRKIFELTRPRMIYAREAALYANAIRSLPIKNEEIVVSEGRIAGLATSDLAAQLQTRVTEAVARAFDRISPDGVAKILFTSGSTGEPKGVVTTHRMLSANQQSIAQCWPFLDRCPPVILDWLPWSHAFGANHNFNIVLRNGGSLYIDGGRPAPGLIEKTVANLRDVSPTIYFNAPRGFDMLLPYLERDPSLAECFFRNLDLIFYAGASLPQNLWDRLERLSIRTRGGRVRMVSSWGTTETTSTATSVHYTIERAGVIGIPAPGVEIKIAPSAFKAELRVRGAVVTPGYWQRPDLTAAAFDEEGYYKTGDAGKLADPSDPAKGIVFDGRVAEDFKLLSGSWVHSGQVRLGVIAACSPVLQDVVVIGRDRDHIGLLILPSLAACKAMTGDNGLTLKEIAGSEKIRSHLLAGLRTYNDGVNGASSMRVACAILLDDPPSIDHGEITDKGYINQLAVCERRADTIERLYAAVPDPDVMTPIENKRCHSPVPASNRSVLGRILSRIR
jgi:feruloyl-CoA synthase